MNYVKPEVEILGNAKGLIEANDKQSELGDDGMDAPAYDLDE